MFKRYSLNALALGCILSGALTAESPKVDFKRDVQPIFKANCYDCHGSSVQMNGFRLDRRRDAMKGGTLAMIGPGNSEGSRLYLKLTGSQYGPQMPPTGPLKPAQIDIIKAWIDQGAEWPDEVSGEAPSRPPDPKAVRLMEALRNGDGRAFQKMLAENPKAAKLTGAGGSTPLMYAALYGDSAEMRLLLDKGADPNARNDAGATALMWAVDDLEKVRLLVEHGAGVNAKSDDGRTPLMIASGVYGNSAVLKLLLARGAKVNVKAPVLFGETTPLVEATYAGDEAAVQLLADHGADVKNAGPLALAFAMRAGCKKCVEMFMKDAAPNVLVPTMFFVSPPFGPAFGVKPLMERGADVKAKDPKGNNILTLAVASEAFPVDAVRALLDHGADVNALSSDGETPLELAKRHGQTPVVDLLMKAGAKEGEASRDPVVHLKPAATPRAAVERSLPLLQRNDATFLRKSGCVSCHNNSLTSIAVVTARKGGFHVDEREVGQQLRTIGVYLNTWRERVLQNVGIPGDTDTAGYILLGLAAANYPPDAATDAMAIFMKRQQTPDGHWRGLGHRPPLESSEIQVTAVAMRGLQVYGPRARRPEYDRAIRLASAWLTEAQPQSTEDRAFQVMGLTWAGADKERIRKAAAGLMAEQRSDGGWAQIPARPSDAYATGETLAALQQAGALTSSDPAAKRGIQFLLNTQAEDGSWYVKRRTVPIQPYFDAGFPYGRDQFISATATNWAAIALAMASR